MFPAARSCTENFYQRKFSQLHPRPPRCYWVLINSRRVALYTIVMETMPTVLYSRECGRGFPAKSHVAWTATGKHAAGAVILLLSILVAPTLAAPTTVTAPIGKRLFSAIRGLCYKKITLVGCMEGSGVGHAQYL